MNRAEDKFYRALKDVFIGAKVEGESGYINLMRIKSRYFEEGVFPELGQVIEDELGAFPAFREELFDKLYNFFQRYFSESGSIYFRYTPLHQKVYEQVYTDERDVMLFWKTHMLYYVKTDRLFQNMETEVDGRKFVFDVSGLQHKQANEKRSLVFEFREKRADDGLVFDVSYSERGRKTKLADMRRGLREAGATVDEEVLEQAFRLFERQSEVDYFINKDAGAFLREQFELWMFQYIFQGETGWTAERIAQLQMLRRIAHKIIDFIAQFEDELVKVWNKPKFVLDAHYIITLDRIGEFDPALLPRFLAHAGFAPQAAEWRELGMVGEDFGPSNVWEADLYGQKLHPRYQFLPLDTRHFPDLQAPLLAAVDHLDDALDGWLINSENYQALNTLLPKFGGRVKCVYIDPPYNTGSDEFLYNDKFQHSGWLSMMSDRLQLSRMLLSDEGVILVSIDDNADDELRALFDQTYGDDNFVAQLAWEKGRKNDARFFSVGHEYVMVYARSMKTLSDKKIVWREAKPGAKEIWKTYVELREKYGDDDVAIEEGLQVWYKSLPDKHPSKTLARYKHIDRFGPWRDRDISWPGGGGPRYDVIHPVTRKPCAVPERGWGFASQEAMQRQIDFGLIVFREDHSNPPFRKAHLRPVPEELLENGGDSFDEDDLEDIDVGMQVMPSVIYKQSQVAIKYLRNLMGGKVFNNPKDHEVIARLVDYVGEPNGTVLDFFAGSGTTGHAVINLNREDGGRRRYILVEMADYFESVILPRIKKVVFSDSWKDGQAQESGQGVSHFCKVFRLEQYEQTLRRARYEDADLFHNLHDDPFNQYVFLRDLKMLDAIDLDVQADAVTVDLSRLYAGIDVAESLSCVTGKAIRHVDGERVIFEDGSEVDLSNPPWEWIKPLIWW